jgi:hypothetical protein
MSALLLFGRILAAYADSTDQPDLSTPEQGRIGGPE